MTAKVIVYGLYPEQAYKDLNFSQIEFLHKNLAFIRKFLSATWLVKNNGINFGIGFLENPFNQPNADIVNSGFMSNIFTNAFGKIESVSFTKEEIEESIGLQNMIYKFTFDENNEQLTHFLQKGNPLIGRVFYFLEIVRATQELSLKIANYCTCFETLFSTETTELSHKLSTFETITQC